MKKSLQRFAALAIGSMLAVTVFAACKPNEEEPPVEVNATDISYRICYDNLNAGYVKDYDTQITVQNAKDLRAVGTDGKDAELSSVATYDEATGTFRAVGAGTVYFKVGKTTGRVEVIPAYVTNPHNQYTGNNNHDMNEGGQAGLLGRGHDPSLIEVEEDGKTVYYIFSTGWSDAKELDGLRTYGNMIHRSEDLLKWEFMGRTFDYSTRKEDLVESEVGLWLYGDGTYATNGYSAADASWWAPDIVPAYGGGYWLYTCVVDGAGDNEGMAIPGGNYARACCLLYHSDTLDAGSFKYVGVLMQSSIKRNETEKDVNGIDPQIIYDTDGKMYMAYGSFGSGDYIIELDPTTGLRKDGKGWQTHEQIRNYIENDIQDLYKNTQNANADNKSIGWTHEYYGTNISKQNMEAPVIARHDNVKVFDETAAFGADGNPTGVEGKTYYYSMHSYNGLGDDYQMWGGRSENVLGVYKSTGGGIVYNIGSGNSGNEGNKYMGAFQWSNKTAGNTELDIILPGHNDLFTTDSGLSLAAYITRTTTYTTSVNGTHVVQLHQYYLNSQGDICINPNRYSGEIDRTVTKEELLHFTDGGKFQMIVNVNQRDTSGSIDNVAKLSIVNKSVEVVLTEDGKITYNGAEAGSWEMYGRGYIKFSFTGANAITMLKNSKETTFYGVVRPAWLGNLNKSGFTITCMGHTNPTQSMGMFMNSQSNMTGTELVG